MSKFTDTISIRLQAGHGGAGAATFHREKYVAFGGPNGGDGGEGGNVFIEPDRRYYNLSHLFKDRLYKAKNGGYGMRDHMHGKNGDDLHIKVPPGTQIIDDDTEEVIADLTVEGESYLVAKGGIGGKGNAFFKSSTNQSPRFAQPGMPGEYKQITLNLKLIADVGLVGLPNAGKSTLLSVVTKARPKIADYPFTTLIPNLGVVSRDNGMAYTIADIPGIIEGAHKGHGLGLSFLQHIERVSVILYIIDVAEDDPLYNFDLLKSELATYNAELLKRPYFIILSKIDLAAEEEINKKIKLFHSDNILPISSHNGENISELLIILDSLLEKKRAT